MKKFFVLIGIVIGAMSASLYADALKNSLTSIMNTDDSSQMVDLSNLNLNAKAKPVKKVIKNRSGKTVIGTVNGHKVMKKEADNYLGKRTQGKVSNFDAIPPEQQKMLLQEFALPILALDAANKELTAPQKQTVLTRVWMQKEATQMKISDDDIQGLYDQLKQQAIDNNDTRAIPPLDSIKERLRMQMIERTIMTGLMKDVKIEIAE